MNKRFVLFLGIMMVSIMLTGCGNDPQGSQGQQDETEVFQLSINYQGPSTNVVGQATLASIAMAEELSDGRLKFTPYWDATFVSYGESIQSTINGVVDICYVDAGNINEVFYLNQLLTMPYTCDIPSRLGAHNVMQQVLTEMPEINQELENVGLTWLGLTNLGSSVLHLSKDIALRQPGDIRGLLIDSPANIGTLVQTLGGTASAMPSSEFYTSMERGVVDGMFLNWDGYYIFALNDVSKAHIIFSGEDGGLWSACCGYIMNKGSWDSIPADLQQIMLESFEFWGEEWIRLSMPLAEEGWKAAKDSHHTFIYLTPEERAMWVAEIEKSNPIILDRIQAAGYDAYDLYDELMELYEAQWQSEQSQQ